MTTTTNGRTLPDCATCGAPIASHHGKHRAWRRGFGYCSQECSGEAKTVTARARLEARLWSKIDKSNIDGCWPYLGRRIASGYGVLDYRNRPTLAHRVAYELTHQANLAPFQFVCHSCDNPPCCNPAHLWVGSSSDNARDMWNKGRGSQNARRGEDHHSAKLSTNDVLDIRSSPSSTGELSKRYSVTREQINNIRSRKAWRHV